MSRFSPARGILFDLDGTLADTAADLEQALNRLRRERGLPPLPSGRLRPWVSLGARAMVQHGIPEITNSTERENLRIRFLHLYQQAPAERTRLFPGIRPLLERLHCPWAIVTNKPGTMARAVTEALGLGHIPLVAGDTLPRAKPHPQPLIHACQQLGLHTANCLMAGDGLRDIQAGRAAGCHTVSVAFGYIPPGDDPHQWQAHQHAETVADLEHICLQWQQNA